MSDVLTLVGERIRNFRKERGLSQEELAHLASLHPTYIGQIERAEKNVTLDSLVKLTGALNITLEDLFRHLQLSFNNQDTHLTKIVLQLQKRGVDDHKFILKQLEQMLDWKDKK
ncbi:helix-turn-helix domain-containing protein [Paenibacillus sp. FSL H8-0034]|uniref:helix-turn-helix domain-containing protein n=1 Tax=Paenibacillus sp. FSL H8-0034 TaxID=2954671 RepID=UPI0030FB1CB8